jgi:archaellum biogenesis protein FlaJ (TadC family)
MKKTKTMLISVAISTLTFIAGVFVYSSIDEINAIEYLLFGVLLIIGLLGIVLGIKNLKAEKKGLTTEDELSKKIRDKAASNSFVASFYLWAMILAFTIDSGISGKTILEIGLTGMCLTYGGFWFYYKYKGIDSENKN